MCGIAGELLFKPSVGPKANWEKISSLMGRRGPDQSGLWSDKGSCTLVFRRLAIIDLSENGHQPMVDRTGRYVLVFNGEVYNFQDIRKDLGRKGITFRSSSDSEVVLNSLIEWGHRGLERFNGMFALGFYDRVERSLLLARDHAGIKPLYYLLTPEGMIFASQYNQLLAHPLSRHLGISQEALGLYLRLAYIPAPYGLLNGSHMLEPGTWVQFTGDGQIQKGKFYTFPRYPTVKLKGMEAIDAVDAVTTMAVKRHLISDVPVGAFLSGGIDSPLVVAKMRKAIQSPVEVFTIGTGEEGTDETNDAMAYAREFDVKQTIESIEPVQALDLLEDVIEACGEPFGDYSIFPTMMVSRLASQQYKVMLSGDGGDELFWGYPERFGKLLKIAADFGRPLWWRWLQRGFQKVVGAGNDGHHLTQPGLGSYHRHLLTHLSESWLNQVFPSLPGWPIAYSAFDYNNSDPDGAAQNSRLCEFVSHLPYVLMKVDRASMFHSLEVRVPLLDREVIEISAQIDWKECLDLQQGLGKISLRQVLARYTNHQTRVKRGFEVPMGLWLKTSLREMMEDRLLKQNDILGLEIDRKMLRKIYDFHLSGKGNYAWGLWPLLSLSLWIDEHYS